MAVLTTTTTAALAGTARRFTVDANDVEYEQSTTSGLPRLINASSVILIAQGDILDIGLVWSAWLNANDATVATSAWADHASTPVASTITTSGYDEADCSAVAILDTTAATVGDTYYISNTITLNDKTTGGTFDLVGRQVTRNVAVRVVL